ncbi:hypothetical protein TrVFT333_005821 [Trichoderma virens FT-333]|nr:hypothetical protein TrVFT333_005821 [Trichoderma virens FT-333]
MASASDDHTIRIWNVEAGDEEERGASLSSIERLFGDHNPFVIFSPNGTFAALQSRIDQPILIWLASTGECIYELHEEEDSGYGYNFWKGLPIFSQDSSLVACQGITTGHMEKVVEVWDIVKRECILRFTGHGIVLCISWSPDSALLATGSTDGIVRICDLETGEQMHTLGGHDLEVSSLEFSNSSDLIASASRDCTVRVWSVATGDCLLVIEHADLPLDMSIVSSQRFSLIATLAYGIVRIWRIRTGELVQELNPGENCCRLNFDPDQLRFNTNVGSIDIRATEEFYTTSMTDVFRPAGYGLSVDGQWITWNGSNLLKLPADYRPVTADIAGSVVVFGSKMWKTIYLSFDTHKLPRKI